MVIHKTAPGFSRTLALVLAACLLLVSGCAAQTATSVATTTTQSAAQVSQDKVTVTYFFAPRTAASIHLATEWILTTVEDGYADEVAQNRLELVPVNVEDAANQAIMDEYGARLPSLFITTTHDGVASTTELKNIWIYLDESLEDEGLKAQFIDTLRAAIDRALGLPVTSTAPITTTTTTTTEAQRLTSVTASVAANSWTDYLELIVYTLDQNGQLMPVEGTISVKLWDRPSFFEDVKGDLLQEWYDVPLTASDFYDTTGYFLSLPYYDFRPHSASIGYVQAVITVNGQVVSSPETPVQVRRELKC
jgi:hypothetical protein